MNLHMRFDSWLLIINPAIKYPNVVGLKLSEFLDDTPVILFILIQNNMMIYK